jgi:kynurenine formamidase
MATASSVVVLMVLAGTAGASTMSHIRTRGIGGGAVAEVRCPGGMSRLGHPFENEMTLFAFDPAVNIEDEYTVAEDFFLVEDIDTGAHAGTHLDAPSHFIDGGRSVDELRADEFVWPAYKMDVRELSFDDGLIEVADIRAYERRNGRIKRGSLVVLQTGAEEFWGAEEVVINEDGQAVNVDDFFDFENPGFSGAAVQWLFDNRKIGGVGSDAYGPDAYSDDFFLATYTTLANDGVALVALANLDSLNVTGDVIMASTVALKDGSGFTTDPLACHAVR